MDGLSHDKYLLSTEGFLKVRGPSIELIFGIWEQNTVVFGFSLLDDLEKLRSYLGCGRDTSIRRTPEDKKHILAFFYH